LLVVPLSVLLLTLLLIFDVVILELNAVMLVVFAMYILVLPLIFVGGFDCYCFISLLFI